MLLTFYTFFGNFFTKFQSLILRSISFIQANKELTFFLFIFTYILGQLYLNWDISSFYNNDVLSEDFSILNAGEGSSQELGQEQAQGSGQGSGQEPGQEPGPGGGNDYTSHLSNTIHLERTDTDRLANYLETLRGLKTINKAGIHLNESYVKTSFHDEEYSRIARYVYKIHPDIFKNRGSPGSTVINDSLLLSIRSLGENVPPHF